MLVRIDDWRVGPAIGVREIKPRAGQPFIEEPDTPGVGARGLGLDQIGEGSGADRGKQPLEDGKIQPFMFEGEGEMTFQACVRRVTRRIDAPAALLHELVPFTSGAEVPGKWHPQIVSLNQRSVARRPCGHGKTLFLKNGNRT